jgi:hypothetical protein
MKLNKQLYFNDELAWNIDHYFFIIQFHLQSIPVQLADCAKTHTTACRRVLSSTLLHLIGSRSFVAFGNEIYELNSEN